MQRLPGLRVPAPFAKEFPEQFVEMGIAEQSLVSTAAGMARCGLRPFAASPASFLSTRSMEQVKVDVAYSHTNVKLIGISGGISYGALGMTHHSAQDIAALASIPGLAGKDLCAGTIDAWLVYKLTGGRVFATDYSNASRTQLFNLRTLSWDEEVCGWFGIGPAMLPEVRFSDSLFGETDFGGLLPHPVPIHGVLGDSHGALMGQEAGVTIQELRVDGGPTKDKFLMQFQSDILNLPVAAPEREELSGMGAAFCAGIAAGVYSKEIFQAVRRSRFLPVMEAALRRKKREGWKQAVETLLTRPGTK